VRVVFVCDIVSSGSDGVGDYAFNLATELAKMGNDVSVICSQSKINVHALFSIVETKRGWDLTGFLAVIRELGKVKPDYVILHYVPGGYSRLAAPWKIILFYCSTLLQRYKVVTIFHETYIRLNWKKLKYVLLGAIQRIIFFAICRLSHLAVTSIDRYRKEIYRWNKNVTVIPIGSNINNEDTEISNRSASVSSVANENFFLCTFGNRNHQLLVRVFQHLQKKISSISLLIIGKCDPAPYHKLIHDGKIHLTGFVDAHSVFQHLMASDLFVLLEYVSPSFEGGVSNKSTSLAAAFAAGLPIVSTRGDMTNDLLLQEASVLWVDYNSAEAIAEAIAKLLVDKQQLENARKRNRIFYEKYLAWPVIANEYQTKVLL